MYPHTTRKINKTKIYPSPLYPPNKPSPKCLSYFSNMPPPPSPVDGALDPSQRQDPPPSISAIIYLTPRPPHYCWDWSWWTGKRRIRKGVRGDNHSQRQWPQGLIIRMYFPQPLSYQTQTVSPPPTHTTPPLMSIPGGGEGCHNCCPRLCGTPFSPPPPAPILYSIPYYYSSSGSVPYLWRNMTNILVMVC